MYVLSRKVGEQIRISDNILLTVVRIGRGEVKIGFEAPREVRIIREETRSKPCQDGGSDDCPPGRPG